MGLRRRKRLLVVEDCASDVHLLTHMLEEAVGKYAFDITSAARLIDAFTLIDETHFDVILLDLNLIDMDGVASVAALNAQVPGTPIIVYSGSESRHVQEAALMCGARNYLVKGHEDGRSLHAAISRVSPPPLSH